MSERKRYTYHVVAANGAAILSREYRSCRAAKTAAENIARQRPEFAPIEIERIEHLDSSGRRFWMRRRSRWMLWCPSLDADDRQPEWIFGVPAKEER